MDGATAGTGFGRYQLLELLGRGGMGEVWRARDTMTNRTVALKVLLPQYADDDTFQKRFLREAQMAAALNEPHIVPIHNYGEIDGRLFVDMRLIEGQDLHTLLDAGPLSPQRAVHIIEQLAMALDAAHEIGLVHRDVKPSNVLVAKHDFTYLIDFGIARGTGDASLTAAGSTVGTWHYMAPERFDTGSADARADIYAQACVLYECLTGARPFPGDSLQQQITGHLVTPPPRPSDAVRGLPHGLDAVVTKGMAKHPEDRYPSALELARAAKSALDDSGSVTVVNRPAPTTPAPTPPPTPPPVRPTAYPSAPPSQFSSVPPPSRFTPTPPPSQFSSVPPPSQFTPMPPAYGSAPPPSQFASIPPPQQPNTGPYGQMPPPGPPKSKKPLIIGVAAAVAVVLVAVIAITAFALSGSDTETTAQTSTRTPTSEREPTTSRSRTPTTTSPQPASDGNNPTIATYIADNNIAETPVFRGDPGSPTVDLAVPDGWAPAGDKKPEWAYDAIVYQGPESSEYTPSIIAIMSKLSGPVDAQALLDVAPGELNNLPGFKAINEGGESTLDGFQAYELGGTWDSEGQTKVVAQKTVIIPAADGLYVLQLNADALQTQLEIVGPATDAIDTGTKIKPA